MRRTILQMIAIAALGTAAGLAYNAVRANGIPLKGGTKPILEGQGIRMMDLQEVRFYLEQKGTIIVDTRSSEEYSLGHIPGSLNVPIEGFEEAFKTHSGALKKASLVILYCGGGSCGTSEEVAKLLQKKGLKELAIFTDGIPGWMKAKLPVKAGLQP